MKWAEKGFLKIEKAICRRLSLSLQKIYPQKSIALRISRSTLESIRYDRENAKLLPD
jgi:hypothetical protein